MILNNIKFKIWGIESQTLSMLVYHPTVFKKKKQTGFSSYESGNKSVFSSSISLVDFLGLA